MKVVLSRKGFDSGYGGYPSLILPDGEMISLPIPSNDDRYYSELTSVGGKKVINIMKQLKPTIKLDKTIKLNQKTRCHLDPDLVYDAVERENGWRGCFGQIGAAQSVLEHNNIKPGDLFLFFGWFNECELDNNKYKFKKGNGKHTMFGYLQIDKIIKPLKDDVPEWLRKHPHASYLRSNKESNCIYVARETCSFNNNIKGYGVFKYNPELDLTKSGCNRTMWDLPDIFRKVSITYHDKDSWKDGYFKSACRGQEFVIEENEDIEKWAINLIEKYAIDKISI